MDVGAGGAAALAGAVDRVGGSAATSVELVASPAALDGCAALLIPALESFQQLSARLDDDLREAMAQHVERGSLLMGIGVGMHVLFDESAEAPGARGLGLLAGRCEALASSTEPMTRDRTHVPHVGWNRLVIELGGMASGAVPLPQGAWVYFAHACHAVPKDLACVTATVEYGKGRVAAVVARDNVVGMQFRPERSGAVGLRILHAVLSRWS